MIAENNVGGIKVYRWLALSIVVIVLDQISKQMVMDSMTLFQSIELTSFFNLYYVHNYGAAFSFLSEQSGWQRWFFTIVTSGVTLGILYWLSKLKASQTLLIAALVFVVGGAVGNLIDRVLFGYVIDFIDWHYGGYHWPAFNVADAAISLGAVLLILDTIINPETEDNNESES